MTDEKIKKKYQRWLTPRQCEFIDFLNDNFKFGKLELTIHTSDPVDYSIKEIKGFFTGNVKEALDKVA